MFESFWMLLPLLLIAAFAIVFFGTLYIACKDMVAIYVKRCRGKRRGK